ncbi:hypothetical protein M3M35_05780 [Fructilactobacillus myrtifloralis]|uniref:Uncharacterized protein n=1 Tax=Fructilactobacillus myrtifloralis TaxID=2940301 RepID=A0ABY5BMK6_9LACO|nr:hypothetical protein [Fructilactobacillus myrtifloralis]USS84815.1 hypothetical protein M3M35_05780 [Fructilactobacillus myrtifloralis]
MTIFSNASHYEKVKPGLVQRDGHKHLIAFKLSGFTFFFDKDTNQVIEEVMSGLQYDGYEILDTDITYQNAYKCIMTITYQ